MFWIMIELILGGNQNDLIDGGEGYDTLKLNLNSFSEISSMRKDTENNQFIITQIQKNCSNEALYNLAK